jgi:hypothetical protein
MDSVLLGRYHLTVAIVFIWRVGGFNQILAGRREGRGQRGSLSFRSRVAPPFSIYTERDKQTEKIKFKIGKKINFFSFTILQKDKRGFFGGAIDMYNNKKDRGQKARDPRWYHPLFRLK